MFVAFEASGHPPFVVGVVSTHFTGNVPLVFGSTDCSGQPFMRLSAVFLVGADLRGYDWSSRTTTAGSSLLPDGRLAARARRSISPILLFRCKASPKDLSWPMGPVPWSTPLLSAKHAPCFP